MVFYQTRFGFNLLMPRSLRESLGSFCYCFFTVELRDGLGSRSATVSCESGAAPRFFGSSIYV